MKKRNIVQKGVTFALTAAMGWKQLCFCISSISCRG